MKGNSMRKRLPTLALALTLVLSLAPAMTGTARAAGSAGPQITLMPPTGTVNRFVSTPEDSTLDDKQKEELESRFWAYQIFAGKIDPRGYDPKESINMLSEVKWGASIKEEKRSELLNALSTDPTPAAGLGITFELMLEAKDTYLSTGKYLPNYFKAYMETPGNWVDGDWTKGEPTPAGKLALQAAFEEDLETLTIGALCSAGLAKIGDNNLGTDSAAEMAAKIMTDFTHANGNSALAQAFYAVVFDREPYDTVANQPGGYKYLADEPVARSIWVPTNAGVTGHWTIGALYDDGAQHDDTLPDGYYMIRDTYSEEDGNGRASAAYMAGVFGYGTMYIKAAAPSVVKNITGGESVEGTSAELGSEIIFTLMATLPENADTAYNGYPYIFEDVLDAGFDFLGIERVYVWVDDPNGAQGMLNNRYDYYVVEADPEDNRNLDIDSVAYNGGGYRLRTSKDAAGKTTVTLALPNLHNLKGKKVIGANTWNTAANAVTIPTAGQNRVYVVYTARLNENANITNSSGSGNAVTLYYANNPVWNPAVNISGGSWETSWNEAPKGRALDGAYAFNFGLQLEVKDGQSKPLTGASFALKRAEKTTGYALADETNVSYAILHRVDTPAGNSGYGTANDTYYLAGWVSPSALANYLAGPDGGASRSWDEPLEFGALIGNFRVPGENYYVSVKSDGEGLVRIAGLGSSGAYTLSEVLTPKDYIPVDDISLSFSSTYFYDGHLDTLTATVDGTAQVIMQNGQFVGVYGGDQGYKELVVRAPVINVPGRELPGTGGEGTALFYLAGGGLLLGAILLILFSNKKKPGKGAR